MMIDTLEAAITSGFTTRISPLFPLLQILIDVSLQLSLFFSEGGWFQDKRNPGLRFGDSYSDDGVIRADSDALGNPRNIKINMPGTRLKPDDFLSDFFSDLATQMAQIAKDSTNKDELNHLRRLFRQQRKKGKKVDSSVIQKFYHRRRSSKKKKT